jgi:hypothetical protein
VVLVLQIVYQARWFQFCCGTTRLDCSSPHSVLSDRRQVPGMPDVFVASFPQDPISWDGVLGVSKFTK